MGDESARDALAETLFDADGDQRRAAAHALARLSPDGHSPPVDFPVLFSGESAAAYVAALVTAKDDGSLGPIDVSFHREALSRAAIDALRGPVERVTAAIAVLSAGETTHVSLGPLTQDLGAWPDDARLAAEEELTALGHALLPELLTVARHPAASARASAVRLLSRVDDPDARAALVRALDDESTAVVRAALSVSGPRHESAVPRVSAILASHEAWAVRTLAADTLGRIGADEGRAALERALALDDYAFVRQAAARALGQLGGAPSRALLSRAASDDPEPRVRREAAAALER
jgi:HEAT repeat protein